MQAKPQSFPLILTAIALIGLALLGPAWRKTEILIVRNVSPSIPLGFYLVHRTQSVHPGEIAVFNLPRDVLRQLGGRRWLPQPPLLIKPTMGVTGNHVCHLRSGLWLNGVQLGSILLKDAQGAKLPQIRGCYRIRRNWFLPFSCRISNSFDGRYFGAIQNKFIIGRATPILTWN